MEIYVKISVISIFSLLLVFKHYFIRCVDFTRVAASSIASNDVQIRSHIEYLTHTYYILVLILVKIDEKFSVNDGF